MQPSMLLSTPSMLLTPQVHMVMFAKRSKLSPGRDHPLSLAFVSGAYLALGELPEAASTPPAPYKEARRAESANPEA